MLKLRRRNETQKGQALVEFALTLPVLLFLVLGLIDFGIILFSYSHASNSLRSALRKAEVLGYIQGGQTPPYLDCKAMGDEAKKGWFSSEHTVLIRYYTDDGKYKNGKKYYDCLDVNTPGQQSWIGNGDMIHITLTAKVQPMFLRFGKLTFTFEGERSIMRSIPAKPNSGGSGTGHDDPSIPVPPAPINFSGVAQCDTGHVNFSWNWGTTDPLPTRAEIRDAYTNSVVANITDVSSTVCEGDCFAAIGAPEIREFYIIAYNGSGAKQKASAPSLTSEVACPSEIPPAPENFDAHVECKDGFVDFKWNWPGTEPQPTRMEVHNDADNSLLLDMSISGTTGKCNGSLCYDQISIPGNRSYHLHAVYGTGELETMGDPSNADAVECVAGGTLTIKLEEDSTGNCNPGSKVFKTKGVTLSTVVDGVTYPYSGSTNNSGIVTFPNVRPGVYTITVPSSAASGSTYYLRSVNRNLTSCTKGISTPYSSSSVTSVASNETVNLVFGYKK